VEERTEGEDVDAEEQEEEEREKRRRRRRKLRRRGRRRSGKKKMEAVVEVVEEEEIYLTMMDRLKSNSCAFHVSIPSDDNTITSDQENFEQKNKNKGRKKR
jgi:hypothetical protein